MLKKQVIVGVDDAGYVLTHSGAKQYIGETMQFIEALGLSEKQESAVKSSIKSIFYTVCFNQPYFWVSPEDTEKIVKRNINTPNKIGEKTVGAF